jgi:hypothetical protein
VNDARGALQLTDARFGAIISQPSHPWTAGASHLYTREFFQLAREHLLPGGVFVQWIGLAFVDEAMLRSLVATLNEAFPYVTIFRPALGAVLFAASDEPLDPVATAGRAVAAASVDFARYGLYAAEDALAAWDLASGDARAFAQGAAPITDDHNPLATHASRIALSVKRCNEILRPYDPLVAERDGLDRLYLTRRVADIGANERAMRLANALPEGAPRLTAIGWVKSVLAPQLAAQAFRRALAADPDAQTARFGLVRLIWRRGQGGGDWAELATPLEGTAAAIAKAWGHAQRGEWEAVRALEPALAAADAKDPTAPEALRMRIEWRIHSADPSEREQAAELAVPMLSDPGGTADLILAARALAAAEKPDDALLLVEFVSRADNRRVDRRGAFALLDELEPRLGAERVQPIRERLNTLSAGEGTAMGSGRLRLRAGSRAARRRAPPRSRRSDASRPVRA